MNKKKLLVNHKIQRGDFYGWQGCCVWSGYKQTSKTIG